MNAKLVAIVIVVVAAASCPIDKKSLPEFGRECTSDADCGVNYSCDPVQTICVRHEDVSSEGEGVAGEGEGAIGEGEGGGGEGEGSETPCGIGNACSAANAFCCNGHCTTNEADCTTCQVSTGCGAGKFCLSVDFATGAGICVAQTSSPLAPYAACDIALSSREGNLCASTAECIQFQGVATGACFPRCTVASGSGCTSSQSCFNIGGGSAEASCFQQCPDLSATACSSFGAASECQVQGCGGFCVQPTTTARSEGETCDPTTFTCGGGLSCVLGICHHVCNPLRSPPDCSGGEGCLSYTADTCTALSICLPSSPCDYNANTGCPGGQKCVEFEQCETACATSGTVVEGSACALDSDCTGDLVCSNAICRQRCNPAAPACPGGQTCHATTDCASVGACGP